VTKRLSDFLINIIPKEHSWKLLLFQNWENIIGNLKDKVIIDQIKDDILYLGVTHPVWAQELHMLAPMLKVKVNASLDQPRIKSIRFKVVDSSFKKKNKFCNNRIQDYVIDPICKKLSKTEQIVLNNVTDIGLRDVMYEFGVRCKKIMGEKR
jgi:hypothetical protein